MYGSFFICTLSKTSVFFLFHGRLSRDGKFGKREQCVCPSVRLFVSLSVRLSFCCFSEFYIADTRFSKCAHIGLTILGIGVKTSKVKATLRYQKSVNRKIITFATTFKDGFNNCDINLLFRGGRHVVPCSLHSRKFSTEEKSGV